MFKRFLRRKQLTERNTFLEKENQDLRDKVNSLNWELDTVKRNAHLTEVQLREKLMGQTIHPYFVGILLSHIKDKLGIQTIYENTKGSYFWQQANVEACRQILGDTSLSVLFPEEDAAGVFDRDEADEIDEVYWRELHEFGECLDTCANRAIDCSMVIPKDTPEYLEYKKELMEKTIEILVRKHPAALFECNLEALKNAERPEMENTAAAPTTPVGRIDFYDFNGEIAESIEYTDVDKFLATIRKENYCGAPIGIVLYRNGKGNTIPQDFKENLDPLPIHFLIEDLPKTQAETAN